jgi:beta-glucosidase
LWHFGEGYSYTSYEYANLKVTPQVIASDRDAVVRVSVDVSNTGGIDGDEIVQLYIRDDLSSVTRPVKELKGYTRVHIKSGETENVVIDVPLSALAFYDLNMNYVAEKGTFTIMVGPSSRDKDLLKAQITLNEDIDFN